MTRAQSFIEGSDFLFAHRTDYETAYRNFKWPALDRFNWTLDYFDPMARDNHAPALHIVNESGDALCLSFAQVSERSARSSCPRRSSLRLAICVIALRWGACSMSSRIRARRASSRASTCRVAYCGRRSSGRLACL